MPDHEYALPIGYQLQHYRIEGLLGHGGFGLTYLAYDSRLQRQVAIKELLPIDFAVRQANGTTVVCRSERDRESMDWARQRFLEEGRMIASLHHPNILAVHDVFEQNGTGYLVTSYIRGGDFLQWMKQRNRPITEAELRTFTVAVLGALDKIHARGALHRDLKPQNILMEPDGIHPVLIDFGNARMSTGEKTKSITSIVTPGYAPFEQYTTRSKQGPWTDVYSLGAVLYRAITGKVPPDSADRVDDDPIVPVSHFTQNGYSEAFLATVDKALQRKASERWQSVKDWMLGMESSADVKDRPQPILHSEPTQMVESSEPSRAIKRIPVAEIIVSITFLALVILTILSNQTISSPASNLLSGHSDNPTAPSPLANRSIGDIYEMKLPGNETMKFCYCPPGTFTMGSPTNEQDRGDDEAQVKVKITKGYWLAQMECTQAQWLTLSGANPSFNTEDVISGDFISGGLHLPVEGVSFENVQAWLSQANEKLEIPFGWKWALPTEAQWEYACRSGTQSPFSFGSVLNGHLANCDGGRPYGTTATGPYLNKTVKTKNYAANAWGLYEMHGNVSEWCRDWYGERLAGGSDPSGPITGSYRVIRGGAWADTAANCRAACRNSGMLGHGFNVRGFRPALVPTD